MNTRHVRTLAALAATGALTLGLTACVSTGDPGSCASPAPSGGASEIIEADGALGSAPDVAFPTPLYSDGVQASTVIEGESDGPKLQDGQYVTAEISLLNGADGEVLQRTGYDAAQPFAFLFDSAPLEGLSEGLACATEGSRVAVTIPAATAFPAGQLPPGISEDGTLVAVVDILGSVTARAHGTVLPSPSGNYPAVVRAPDGRPGVTMPGGAPPEELQIATLVDGDGDDRVEEGDQVLVQYTGVNWETGEVFDSSWERGAPATLAADEQAVIPGFAKALVGQKVGSQVVAVLPPSEGYGDQESAAIPAGSTLVFVIDILSVE